MEIKSKHTEKLTRMYLESTLKNEEALAKFVKTIDIKIDEMLAERRSEDIIYYEKPYRSQIDYFVEPSSNDIQFIEAWIMKDIDDEKVKEEIRDRVPDFYKDNSYIQIERFKDKSNKKTTKEGYRITIPFFKDRNK